MASSKNMDKYGIKIEKVPSGHESILEQWEVVAENPDIFGISIAKQDSIDFSWSIVVNAAEFIRDDPLETKFRNRIARALSSIEGVKQVEEADREVWVVSGSPEGREMAKAVVDVLISLNDEIQSYIEEF